jgi:hypothetical protein
MEINNKTYSLDIEMQTTEVVRTQDYQQLRFYSSLMKDCYLEIKEATICLYFPY